MQLFEEEKERQLRSVEQRIILKENERAQEALEA